MNKKIILSALFSCIIFLFAACSLSNRTVVPDDILLKMDVANSRASLMENNLRVAYKSETVDANGHSTYIYTYCDQEKYVYEEDGYLTVDSSGTVISYWEEEKIHEITLYIGDGAYETEQQKHWPVSWYSYSPTETILSTELNDGFISIRTEYSEDVADLAVAYGFKPEDLKKVSMHYVINAETNEIQKMSGEFLLVDGTSRQCIDVERIDNCEEYIIPQEFFSAAGEVEYADITLIENPGTQDEQRLQYSVPVGYYVYLTFSQEYEAAIYSTAAYTHELDMTSAPIANDMIGYIKKAN